MLWHFRLFFYFKKLANVYNLAWTICGIGEALVNLYVTVNKVDLPSTDISLRIWVI